jgi:hypothetical protein
MNPHRERVPDVWHCREVQTSKRSISGGLPSRFDLRLLACNPSGCHALGSPIHRHLAGISGAGRDAREPRAQMRALHLRRPFGVTSIDFDVRLDTEEVDDPIRAV